MNLQILKFGKVAHKETLTLAHRYTERLRKPWQAEIKIVKESFELDCSNKSIFFIGLTEEAKTYSTKELWKKLDRQVSNPSIKSICFVIGGPYGIPSEVKKQMNELISLSPLTFTSDLALLLLSEQLYRIYSLVQGKDYHHE